MNADELLESWGRLPVPSTVGTLEATEVVAGSGVWVALDHTATRHLLVHVPDGNSTPPITTKGLAARIARHRITGQPDADYIDIVCLDDAGLETFSSVAAEIAREVGVAAPHGRSAVAIDVLARWRWFWGISPDRLSERDALGLFAELWFLEQWTGIEPASVDAWTASDNARHDFQWPTRSVEVKATARRADGAVLHTIQHLDQLADPESGVLYLFSLRVVRDRLAGNTLPALVDRCSEALRGTGPVRESFLRKVSIRGYNPAHRRLHATPYRILEERVYEVDETFPRLTRDSFAGDLSSAISSISYTLDMAACEPWLRATRPDEWRSP